jgi:UDP-2-acetamido-2,6-beta-L-arabino-hexul-4-ose reductase
MTIKKIGITGQTGFVGTHLYNTLGLYPDKFERISFEDGFFQDKQKLEKFVFQCDVIIHLAAMNRHNDPQIIYDTNITLVRQIISACEHTKSTPHILFSSSTQEERDNPYGKSKKEGRGLFEDWAKRAGSKFTGLVIPNIFGPFGNPYYNSVVATFCHQLTHGETPKIDVDGELNLIYVGELVNEILSIIDAKETPVLKGNFCEVVKIQHTSTIKVSVLLENLERFKQDYFDKAIIPDLDNPFERNLFNTFVCYIDHETFFPFHLTLNTDARGSFVETVKLNGGGQVSFSTTVPGITRGNHFHTRKAERFAVIKGKARIDIRRIDTDKVLSFNLDGKQPSFVDMPIWFTHNVTNIGEEELYIIFWISEHFDQNDPDTFIEKV